MDTKPVIRPAVVEEEMMTTEPASEQSDLHSAPSSTSSSFRNENPFLEKYSKSPQSTSSHLSEPPSSKLPSNIPEQSHHQQQQHPNKQPAYNIESQQQQHQLLQQNASNFSQTISTALGPLASLIGETNHHHHQQQQQQHHHHQQIHMQHELRASKSLHTALHTGGKIIDEDQYRR